MISDTGRRSMVRGKNLWVFQVAVDRATATFNSPIRHTVRIAGIKATGYGEKLTESAFVRPQSLHHCILFDILPQRCLISRAQAMRSTVKPSAPTNQTGPSPNWEELTQKAPEPTQLDNIKAQLDLVLLALEAMAEIGSEAMLKVAAELNLEPMVADRVALWRLRQSNPLRKGQGGRKKLDVEEARSLVLISCHLASQHQALIRRAVALLEQMAEQNREPHTIALLGDYIDRFSNTYADRMEDAETLSAKELTNLALKLLIDLLFYSSPGGHRRLWLALLDRAKT